MTNTALSFKELNNMLVGYGIENVISHLTGNTGKRTGDYLHLADVNGGEGKSLAVYLTGANAGYWFDNATGEKGDLVEFWVANKKINKETAYREIMSFLGYRNKPSFDSPHLRVVRKISFQGESHPVDKTLVTPASDDNIRNLRNRLTKNPKAMQYLYGRGLTDETIEYFGLGLTTPYRKNKDSLYTVMP